MISASTRARTNEKAAVSPWMNNLTLRIIT